MKPFRGICAALLTPYDGTGKVNHSMLAKQVRWLIEQGIDGFYVCGSTGEAFLLTADERKAVLDTVCQAKNWLLRILAKLPRNTHWSWGVTQRQRELMPYRLSVPFIINSVRKKSNNTILI